MMDKTSLMKKIQMYDFILTDVSLFLDTHPSSKPALDYFSKYNTMRADAYKEYIDVYGAFDIANQNTTNRWKWIDNPWPWEISYHNNNDSGIMPDMPTSEPIMPQECLARKNYSMYGDFRNMEVK